MCSVIYLPKAIGLFLTQHFFSAFFSIDWIVKKGCYIPECSQIQNRLMKDYKDFFSESARNFKYLSY